MPARCSNATDGTAGGHVRTVYTVPRPPPPTRSPARANYQTAYGTSFQSTVHFLDLTLAELEGGVSNWKLAAAPPPPPVAGAAPEATAAAAASSIAGGRTKENPIPLDGWNAAAVVGAGGHGETWWGVRQKGPN